VLVVAFALVLAALPAFLLVSALSALEADVVSVSAMASGAASISRQINALQGLSGKGGLI